MALIESGICIVSNPRFAPLVFAVLRQKRRSRLICPDT
jgi:hypothetical protein